MSRQQRASRSVDVRDADPDSSPAPVDARLASGGDHSRRGTDESTLVADDRAKDAKLKRISFLYESYLPHLWFFEILECLRRLAMTGALSGERV